MFEKIINKLLEYNERINSGKEISLVDYLKRIDAKSAFMQQYVNQRLLRRAFIEEFKIHSFNFILLLFESVTRLLATMNMDIEDPEDDDPKKPKKKDQKGGDEPTQYYSRNYRRFLEQRAKKVDQFIVNCIGWSHVLRCIEVVEMAMRDLIYKIVPPKIVVRELKTSTGKILTKDSEYTLVEKKITKIVNKKKQDDYEFQLDLKEEKKDLEEETKDDDKDGEPPLEKWFINMEDFSIYKLRSAIFLMQWPLAFTMAIVNVWYKILPADFGAEEKFNKEELEEIKATKASIKEFCTNLANHVGHLLEFLQNIKKEKPMSKCFKQVKEDLRYFAFKSVMQNQSGSTLKADKVDEMIEKT